MPNGVAAGVRSLGGTVSSTQSFKRSPAPLITTWRSSSVILAKGSELAVLEDEELVESPEESSPPEA
ncbi:hypothetical protein, partial [Proteus mirabilis]|uniref:hypothetical protein n=1 Tax=Proteus mirabilis TaxID=584 RepID=UPI001376E094